MELVYLWVEDYKNIQKQGFNFSPRFRCKYDEEKNELSIDENKDYVSIFPDNINITAIVGENGSGKSSIVECLEKLLTFDRMQHLINLENSRYILIADFNKNLIISSDIEKLVYPKIYLIENEPTKWLDLNMVKYNAELPYVEYNKMKYLENNFIRISSLYQAKKSHLIAFDSEQIASKIIELNIKSFENITHLFFPKYFIMNEKDNIDKYFILYPDGKASMWNCGHGFDSEDIDPKSEKVLNRISSAKEIFAFKKFIEFAEESLITESNINLYLDEIISSQNIFKCISKILYNQNNYSIDKFISFLKRHSVNKLISDIDKEEIYKYLDYLNFEIINDKNIEFSSLSYGEKTFFVTILNLVYQSQISNNNIIFFLDEIEISLHPNWQKTILKDIISIFDKTTKHIHFILNSHSPFILSDLPKENIIFLEKGKQVYPFENGQTFGANIHTLLSHGFFMKDGLMGEFAKSKIDKAIEYLNKTKLNDKEISYCENIISIIGEPIIKRELQRKLDSKRLSKLDKIDEIEKQMKIMEEQRKLLEHRLEMIRKNQK